MFCLKRLVLRVPCHALRKSTFRSLHLSKASGCSYSVLQRHFVPFPFRTPSQTTRLFSDASKTALDQHEKIEQEETLPTTQAKIEENLKKAHIKEYGSLHWKNSKRWYIAAMVIAGIYLTLKNGLIGKAWCESMFVHGWYKYNPEWLLWLTAVWLMDMPGMYDFGICGDDMNRHSFLRAGGFKSLKAIFDDKELKESNKELYIKLQRAANQALWGLLQSRYCIQRGLIPLLGEKGLCSLVASRFLQPDLETAVYGLQAALHLASFGPLKEVFVEELGLSHLIVASSSPIPMVKGGAGVAIAALINDYPNFENLMKVLSAKERNAIVEVFSMLGQNFQMEGNMTNCIKITEDALRFSPGNPNLLMYLSTFYNQVQQYDKANEYARQALRHYPEQLVGLRFTLATNLYKHSSNPEAINEAIEHLQLGLKHAAASNFNEIEQFYFLLTEIFQSQNRMSEAANVLKGLCESPQGRNLGKAHLEYGKVLMKTKNKDDLLKAREALVRAASLQKYSSSIQYQCASCTYQLGDLPASLNYCDAALRMKPEYFEALFLKGRVLKKLKNWEKMAETYSGLSELRPELSILHYEKAIALEQLHRGGEAISTFTDAVNSWKKSCTKRDRDCSEWFRIHPLDYEAAKKVKQRLHAKSDSKELGDLRNAFQQLEACGLNI